MLQQTITADKEELYGVVLCTSFQMATMLILHTGMYNSKQAMNSVGNPGQYSIGKSLTGPKPICAQNLISKPENEDYLTVCRFISASKAQVFPL